MVDAFIGLGSNLENPQEQVLLALTRLRAHKDIANLQVSSLYRSKPYGVTNQPGFTNAVAKFSTNLSALELLDLLQMIEQEHKRVRLIHWGPRTLDLDLLYYGNEFINNERLIVPHPQILLRAFVVIPLLEIAPDFMTPDGFLLRDIIPKLPKDDVEGLKVI